MDKILDIAEVLLEVGLSNSATEEERAIANSAIVRAEGAVRRHLGYDPKMTSRTEFYPRMNLDPQLGRAVYEVDGSSAYLRRITSEASSELQVQHVPIRSSPAIQLWLDYDGRSGARSGSFAAETLKIEGEDYWPNYDGWDEDNNSVCRDGIIRSMGTWPIEPGSVKITYTGGYSEAELRGVAAQVDATPIHDATLDEAVRRLKKAYALMKQSTVGLGAGPFISEKLGDYSYTLDATATTKLFGGSFDLLAESVSKLESFVNYGWSLMS